MTRREVIVGGAALLGGFAFGKPTRGVLGAKGGEKGIRLPYAREVEYLESTGTQWIDTGIYPSNNLRFSIDFNLQSIDSGFGLFGGRTGVQTGSYTLFFIKVNASSSRYFRFDGSGLQTSFGSSITINTASKYRIEYDGNNVSAHNLTTGESDSGSKSISSFTGVRKISLFAVNTNGAVGFFMIGRIYSCKFYNGSTLVADFTPIRFTNELGQSEGAMYDRASGQLFRNAGTGAFVIGPDKQH